EAVANFRGEGEEELPELKVELPIDAHIPHDYVAEERLRLEAYAKIAAAENDAAIDDTAIELTDRHGRPPEPAQRLFAVARLRAKARTVGLADITSPGKFILYAPIELAVFTQLRPRLLSPCTVVTPATRTALVPAPMTFKVGGNPLRDEPMMEWVATLIDAVFAHSVAAAAQVAGDQ